MGGDRERRSEGPVGEEVIVLSAAWTKGIDLLVKGCIGCVGIRRLVSARFFEIDC